MQAIKTHYPNMNETTLSLPDAMLRLTLLHARCIPLNRHKPNLYDKSNRIYSFAPIQRISSHHRGSYAASSALARTRSP